MSKPDKRQQIMQAAERMFTSLRMHEITMEQVAEEARVSKGTLYLYFKDKDDLFFETANSGFDELCEILREKVPVKAPFSDQLVTACTHVSSFFQGRRQLVQMMQQEEARLGCNKDHELQQRMFGNRARLNAALAEIIVRGVAEGLVREDIHPEVLAHFLMGMLRARGRQMSNEQRDQTDFDCVVELFLHGATHGSRGGGPGASREPTITSQPVLP